MNTNAVKRAWITELGIRLSEGLAIGARGFGCSMLLIVGVPIYRDLSKRFIHNQIMPIRSEIAEVQHAG